QLLKDEENKYRNAPFEGVIERASSPDHVNVTPWVKGQGCLCGARLKLPRSSIADIKPTDQVHLCCGNNHTVFAIKFAPTHADLINGLFRQIAATTARRGLDTSAPLALTAPAPFPMYPPISAQEREYGNCGFHGNL